MRDLKLFSSQSIYSDRYANNTNKNVDIDHFRNQQTQFNAKTYSKSNLNNYTTNNFKLNTENKQIDSSNNQNNRKLNKYNLSSNNFHIKTEKNFNENNYISSIDSKYLNQNQSKNLQLNNDEQNNIIFNSNDNSQDELNLQQINFFKKDVKYLRIKKENENLNYYGINIKSLNFMGNFKVASLSQISNQIVNLPKTNKKIQIALDLDETLIRNLGMNSELFDNKKDIYVQFQSGQTLVSTQIRPRPFVREFFNSINNQWEIFLQTAGKYNQAKACLESLGVQNKFTQIFDRDYCFEQRTNQNLNSCDKFQVKDLRILKNREINNVLIVDNQIHSFSAQSENGIPIKTQLGVENDTSLVSLAMQLEEIRNLFNNKTISNLVQYNVIKWKLLDLIKLYNNID